MTDKPVLVILDPHAEPDELLKRTLKTHSPQDIYTLFTPDKHTSRTQQEHIDSLRQQTNIPEDHHLTIPVKGIIQKTWRVIKRFTSTDFVPPKNNPDRKAKLNQLREENHKRLSHLEAEIKLLIAQDQATRLKANLISEP